MIGQIRTKMLVSVSLLASCVIGTPALAQDSSAAASDSASAEIIVTARRRAESLQDVPLSVQAFTAEALAASNINNVEDLAAFAPGLQLFQNVDRGYGQIFIRGMQNTPPVGDTTRELASIFVDGVFFTGGVAAINTDNIERVEVIRGPQSALFGRATFSGAVNFITKTPGNEFAASVTASAATDDDYLVSASIDAPLVRDVLAARISGRFQDFGGQYTNAFNGAPLGEQQDVSLSGQLYFTPGERLKAKVTVNYIEQRDGPASSMLVGRLPDHNFTLPNGQTTYRGVIRPKGQPSQNPFAPDSSLIFSFPPFPATTPFDSTANSERLGLRRTGMERDYFFASLSLDYDVGGGHTLSYLGGYSDEEAERLYDFELSPESRYFGSRRTDSRTHSHELRLTSPDDGRFRWLVGAYYLDTKLFERDPGNIVGRDFSPVLGLPVGGVAVGAGPRIIVDRSIQNYAVFGSLGYKLTDQLSLSLEGRWQSDELTDVVNPATGATLSGTTRAFLPRGIIEYRPNDDLLLYASVAKGLRPTTINSQFAARSDADKALIRQAFPELVVDLLAPPETIWSYELGLKSTALDGRLVFNANAYYSDWKNSQDLQSLLAVLSDGFTTGTLVTINGPDIEAYGLELDANFRASNALTLGGAFAWNHTSLTGPRGESQQLRFLLQQRPNGERLSQTPEISGSFFGMVEGDLGGKGMRWFARAEGVYVGSRFASTLNLTETGDSFDANLRIGIQNATYSATLFVTNLFQDKTFESLRGNADCATSIACGTRAFEVMLPNRRQFGITLRANFK